MCNATPQLRTHSVFSFAISSLPISWTDLALKSTNTNSGFLWIPRYSKISANTNIATPAERPSAGQIDGVVEPYSQSPEVRQVPILLGGAAKIDTAGSLQASVCG